MALTGDGGDELFAGYPRYQANRLAGWLDGLPRPVRRMAGAGSGSDWSAAGRSARTLRRRPFGRSLASLARAAARRVDCHFRRDRAGRRCTATTSWPRLPDADPVDFFAAAYRIGRSRSDHAGQPGRPGDVFAVRSDDQGRHDVDGQQPGVPAAVSRPSRGRTGRPDAESRTNSVGAAASGMPVRRRLPICCRPSRPETGLWRSTQTIWLARTTQRGGP